MLRNHPETFFRRQIEGKLGKRDRILARIYKDPNFTRDLSQIEKNATNESIVLTPEPNNLYQINICQTKKHTIQAGHGRFIHTQQEHRIAKINCSGSIDFFYGIGVTLARDNLDAYLVSDKAFALREAAEKFYTPNLIPFSHLGFEGLYRHSTGGEYEHDLFYYKLSIDKAGNLSYFLMWFDTGLVIKEFASVNDVPCEKIKKFHQEFLEPILQQFNETPKLERRP